MRVKVGIVIAHLMLGCSSCSFQGLRNPNKKYDSCFFDTTSHTTPRVRRFITLTWWESYSFAVKELKLSYYKKKSIFSELCPILW